MPPDRWLGKVYARATNAQPIHPTTTLKNVATKWTIVWVISGVITGFMTRLLDLHGERGECVGDARATLKPMSRNGTVRVVRSGCRPEPAGRDDGRGLAIVTTVIIGNARVGTGAQRHRTSFPNMLTFLYGGSWARMGVGARAGP